MIPEQRGEDTSIPYKKVAKAIIKAEIWASVLRFPTMEANIYLLEERMATIAEDSRLLPVVAVGAPTEVEGASMDARCYPSKS